MLTRLIGDLHLSVYQAHHPVPFRKMKDVVRSALIVKDNKKEGGS